MTAQSLAEFAQNRGHEVAYLPLHSMASFSVEDAQGCHVVLSSAIHGTAEKECLAHELGHCEYGGFYNRYSPYDIRAKAERRADKWAFSKLVPYGQIMAAIKQGITEVWELAEYFDVSTEFMSKALAYYKTAIA